MVKRLTTSGDDDTLPLGSLLAAAAQHLSHALNDALARAGYHDVRAAHAPVFLNIDADGTRSTVLAARARMSKQAMGELLSHLTRLGYVTSSADPNDRRAKLHALTARGLTAFDVARRVIGGFDRWLDDEVGAGQVARLRGTLHRIIDTEPARWGD